MTYGETEKQEKKKTYSQAGAACMCDSCGAFRGGEGCCIYWKGFE